MNQSVSRQGCDQINKRDRKFTEIEWWRFTKKQAAILTQVHEKFVCPHSDEMLWNASRKLGVFRIGRLILTRFMWNGAGRCCPELGLHSLRYTSWYTSVSFRRGVIHNHRKSWKCEKVRTKKPLFFTPLLMKCTEWMGWVISATHLLDTPAWLGVSG